MALTAHAMAEDRARFHAAGIDDCLIKPVTEETMVRALTRAAEALPPLADAATLSQLARHLGPVRLPDFLARLEQEGEAALASLTASPQEERIAACHRLAGSAGSFGLLRLSDRLRRLETALRAGQNRAAAVLVEGLPDLWRQSLAELKAEVTERAA